MAEFDLQRLCRNVIHSNDVSIESLPKILQKDFQYECCYSDNLRSAYQNNHLECAKAYNLSKRDIQESSILRLSLIDGKIDWLKWSRENGALWTRHVKPTLDDCEDILCLEYAAANGAYDTDEEYSDYEEDSSDEDPDSYYLDSSDEELRYWHTGESNDEESNEELEEVLDVDEQCSYNDDASYEDVSYEDDNNKIIQFVRSKLPEASDEEIEENVRIVKEGIKFFDITDDVFKWFNML